MLNIISLGAGVQSSTMALMAAHGEITPMPDCAIFADTGAEPNKVYEWLDWLETQLPFPVHRVMRGNGLREGLINSLNGDGDRKARPPFFITPSGMLNRQCTAQYKIVPIKKKVRDLLGLKKGERAGKDVRVIQWIGISTDEASRMKPSYDKWIVHRWPLIDFNMSRESCLNWMLAHGYPKPSKSACTFCPYHDNALWRDMKENDPKSFSDAVLIDALIRPGIPSQRNNSEWFVHRDRLPLDHVDFRTAEDAGQLSMFNNECEGMCGV